MTFNGFISYSHAADGRLAPAVQRGLHRLAKPWHRRRALWIFRDQTGLSVTPGLWSSIQTALDGSDYFVLLASPEAARSQWVNREIEHWIATKSADQILPVVTDGEWDWDQDKHDFTEESTAVPAALRGVFAEEPLFLDLRWARGSEHLSLQHSRFRDAIAQLAAPMHGVSKDELEGEDVRQHRRARRLRSGAVATLVVLTMLATLTGVSAVRNSERARSAAAEALRQQLVAEEQRGSAERFAEEARQQQELAKQQQARAVNASAEADRSEQLALEQQKQADQAAAEARRQQRLADQAATRTRAQQQLAKEASERARRLQKEADRLAKAAKEQRKRAREAAAEARKQQAKAEEQQRIAVSRRLITQGTATVGADPKMAVMLGAAAQKLHSDAENRSGLTGIVTSTRYAGAVPDVRSAGYAPDGVLVALGKDGGVSLWNVKDRTRPVRIAALPQVNAKSMTLSPDGRTLLLVDWAYAATLWDVTNRSRPVRTAALPTSEMVWNAVAFSPDGVTLATGMAGGTTILWDITDRTRPKPLASITEGNPYPASALVFGPDGRTLFVNKEDVTVYDLTDRADPVLLRELPDADISPMALSPDERTVVGGTAKGEVLFYYMPGKTGAMTRKAADAPPGPPLPPPWPDLPDDPADVEGPVRRLTGLTGHVESVVFSRDGRWLAAADMHGTALVWDMTVPATPLLVTRVQARGAMNDVAFSPDGATLVTADSSATATMWDVEPRGAPDSLAALTVPGGESRAMALRPDGRALIAAAADGTAKVWDVTDPARPGQSVSLRTHSGRSTAVAVSPDHRTVAASGNGRLMLTDVSRPARPVTLATLTGNMQDTQSMAFSPDGRALVVAGHTNFVLWDVSDRTRPTLRAALDVGVILGRVAFSPDGYTLAVANGWAVTLWNVAGRAAPVPVATLAGHNGDVTALAFSPNGRNLATGGADAAAMMWDITDRTRPLRLAIMPGHGDKVTSVAFSPDGRTLAAGSLDNSVHLWDTAKPVVPIRLATLRAGLRGEARSLAFQRDGRTLAVTSQPNGQGAAVTLWNYTKLNKLRVDPAKHACAISGRGLTAAEWARLIPELPYRRSCA